MVSLSALAFRGKLVESEHNALCIVQDIKKNIILSSENTTKPIFPRSAIKIFQAMPFIASNAHLLFNLDEKQIAISCSSHIGELFHLEVLKQWIRKINIPLNLLKCGIHNPIDQDSSNNLMLSGNKPSVLHNNCSGKHLGMISGCLAKKINIKNYLKINNPYQKLIRNVLENFMEKKIKKEAIGVDGCNAPQYAFPLKNISTSMINLIKTKEENNEYANSLNTMLKSIKKFPLLIGGHNRFDSDIIKYTKGRIFAKGGAEGVLLFADFEKKIGGALKVLDGNNRAIPSIAMEVFLKLNLLNENEKKALHKWKEQIIYNVANKKIGKIIANLQ